MLPPHRLPLPPDLHVCSSCGRDFLVPVSVVELLTSGRCVVELHCTNCDASSLAVHDDAELMALDRKLDATTEDLRDALEILVVADELERIDRFVHALHADHVLPEDF